MSQPYDPYQVPDESRQSAAPFGAPAGDQHSTGYQQHPLNAGAAQPYGAPAGQQAQAYSQGYVPPMPPSQVLPQGFAVAALVLGLIGLLVSWFTVGIPSILAVIFGHIGLSRANRGTASGKGMAIAGLVLGYLVVGLIILLLAVAATFVAWAPSM